MIAFAHVGGLPVEELLAGLAGPGAGLAAARAWLAVHLRRRSAAELIAAIDTKPLPRKPEG